MGLIDVLFQQENGFKYNNCLFVFHIIRIEYSKIQPLTSIFLQAVFGVKDKHRISLYEWPRSILSLKYFTFKNNDGIVILRSLNTANM